MESKERACLCAHEQKKSTRTIKKVLGYTIVRYAILALSVCGFILVMQLVSARFLPFGFDVQMPFITKKYHTYTQKEHGITFRHTDHYVIDTDEKQKYGENYIVGLHMVNDARTGCDIRHNAVGINFTKSDQEINDAIYNDLAKNVKGLTEYQGKRIVIDGEDAMRVDFLLTDPLGNILHISQAIVSHDGNDYLIACGGNASQYAYFAQDFQLLFDSLQWIK